MKVLSSMIRGGYFDGRRRFIEKKGIRFILILISNSKDNSIRLSQLLEDGMDNKGLKIADPKERFNNEQEETNNLKTLSRKLSLILKFSTFSKMI